MLPILISLSVAPTSYFFCASASPANASATAAARKIAGTRPVVVIGMSQAPEQFLDLSENAFGSILKKSCPHILGFAGACKPGPDEGCSGTSSERCRYSSPRRQRRHTAPSTLE